MDDILCELRSTCELPPMMCGCGCPFKKELAPHTKGSRIRATGRNETVLNAGPFLQTENHGNFFIEVNNVGPMLSEEEAKRKILESESKYKLLLEREKKYDCKLCKSSGENPEATAD